MFPMSAPAPQNLHVTCDLFVRLSDVFVDDAVVGPNNVPHFLQICALCVKRTFLNKISQKKKKKYQSNKITEILSEQ